MTWSRISIRSRVRRILPDAKIGCQEFARDRADGLNTIADRNKRFGLIHTEQNPAIRRSRMRRLGARRRERFTIKSWCLIRTDSAITERNPPGWKMRRMVVMRWTRRTIKSRMPAWYQAKKTMTSD